MRALNHKLNRELWRLRGQVMAIAIVVGSGVAVLVMSLSTVEALEETVGAYYERYAFAEVFTAAKRAPQRIVERIAAIPGVQRVQTRISRYAALDIDGFAEPATGRLISIPEDQQPGLNQLVLRKGRWIERGRHNEVIVSEPFAEAHYLAPGDEFSAIINGHKRRLAIVGVALSPEFIYALGPGALLPDDRRFGVIWMGREALAAAFDLKNAFNDLSITLVHGTSPQPVIEELDAMLEPFGGISSITRTDQISNWFVMNEIAQNKTMSTILPAIFLAVAAFLSHMVLTRLIATERSEIGLFKAFGYSNLEIGWHYGKFVIAIAVIGSVLGWALGAVLGRWNTGIYAELFRFPLLVYRPSAVAFLLGGAVSVAAMLIGALSAVRSAVKLPPAEAMRPPAPAVYRHSRLLTANGGISWFDQPTRIALRQIRRWPFRAAMTSLGIALSVGLLIMALQWNNSIDYIAQSYFFEAQHQSMSVGLHEPMPLSVVQEFRNLPGVMLAEPWRAVAADFTSGTRRHRGGIVGIENASRLQPVYDEATRQIVGVPPSGIQLGSHLAAKLGVSLGDEVWIEVLEGRRPAGAFRVTSIYETTIAMPANMNLVALNRLLQEAPTAQFVNLLVDPAEEPRLFEQFKDIPSVSAVMLKRAAVDTFYATIAEHMLVFIFVFTGFACALGFGVAYNSTRIALSERGRELATLRVLGFTRGEISYILLAEVALLIYIAMPLGCLAGRGITLVMARAFDTELFRMPFVINASTYGLGVLFAILATSASAEIVRRRVAQLDLIRVLKTRE